MAIHMDAEYTAASLARRLAKVMVTEGPHCHTHMSMARDAFEELAEQMGYRVERIQPAKAEDAA